MFTKKIFPLILFLFLAILNYTSQKSGSAAVILSQMKVGNVTNQEITQAKENVRF